MTSRVFRIAPLALIVAIAPTALAQVQAPAVGVVGDPCADVFEHPVDAEPRAGEPRTRWVKDWPSLDWAQLCRYEPDNAALARVSGPRVVFIGDSITEGWKNADPDFFDGVQLDRGISGQTTTQMLARFRADVLDLKPDVVHIMAGTNDIAGNAGPTTLARIQGNIMSMVELARLHGIRVVLASIPPAKQFGWRPAVDPVPQVRAMNLWLRDYARQNHLTYVNYYGVLADGSNGLKPAFSADGVHPNSAGYARMRWLASAAIRAAETQSTRRGERP